MTTNSNPKIKKLIDEVEALDPSDSSLEAKLAQIAREVAKATRKSQAKRASRTINNEDLIDPAEAFMCEGCQ